MHVQLLIKLVSFMANQKSPNQLFKGFIIYCYKYYSKCNCSYILFSKLPWPGDNKGIFPSSSQAASCPSAFHTRWRLHTVPLIAERQAGKLLIPIFLVFGLTRRESNPSLPLVPDALSTRPLIY